MNSKQQQKRTLAWGTFAAILIIGLIYFLNPGYSRLGESGSEIALSLISACNLRDVQRIESLSEQFQQAQSEGRLEADEIKWLGQALDYASQGNWDSAQHLARDLLKEQVVPNKSLPELK